MNKFIVPNQVNVSECGFGYEHQHCFNIIFIFLNPKCFAHSMMESPQWLKRVSVYLTICRVVKNLTDLL